MPSNLATVPPSWRCESRSPHLRPGLESSSRPHRAYAGSSVEARMDAGTSVHTDASATMHADAGHSRVSGGRHCHRHSHGCGRYNDQFSPHGIPPIFVRCRACQFLSCACLSFAYRPFKLRTRALPSIATLNSCWPCLPFPSEREVRPFVPRRWITNESVSDR